MWTRRSGPAITWTFCGASTPACVDLIYLDPPFNSNQDYAAPVGSQAAGAAFKDTWTLSDLDVAWLGLVADQHPAVYQLLTAAGLTHGKGMQAYLCMMAVRLLEMRRVLKDTGSIYLHCDDAAGHYLKLLMDSVFGASNYRNHLVWRRATAHNDRYNYGRIVEHILYYGKTERPIWNWEAAHTPKTQEDLKKAYPKNERTFGPVRSENLTGPNVRYGESGAPWHGYDVSARGRHWAPPRAGHYAEYIEQHFIPDYRSIEGTHARLDALDAAGLIHHPKRGKWPGLKRYAAADRGYSPQNLILAPIGFTNFNKGTEWVGYPTQKPLALLERIIAASSNEGDVVLDPFCGCATTLIAAEKLGRQWAGIDLSEKAVDLVKLRLSEAAGQSPGTAAGRGGIGDGPHGHTAPDGHWGGTTLPPAETRPVWAAGRQMQRLRDGVPVPGVYRRPYRATIARRDGRPPENLQLLCSHCNSVKGNRPQEYLVARLQELGVR